MYLEMGPNQKQLPGPSQLSRETRTKLSSAALNRGVREGTSQAGMSGRALALRLALSPAGPSEVRGSLCCSAAHRPVRLYVRGCCRNVVASLKAGSQSSPDVALQVQWWKLEGDGALPGDGHLHRVEKNSTEGISAFGARSAAMHALLGSPGHLHSSSPAGIRARPGCLGKTTPTPLLPRCLFRTGFSTSRSDFQAEGTVRLTFSSEGQGPCVPVHGSLPCAEQGQQPLQCV